MGGDDFSAAQGAPDGADADVVSFAVQVFADGVGSGVEVLAGEFVSEV